MIYEDMHLTVEERLQKLHDMPLLPAPHVEYLHSMNIAPKVIYDIGACVLHWTNRAKEVWPNAEYVLFEAMDEVKFLYDKYGYTKYALGVVSDVDGKKVRFYQIPHHPGGNSYYKEQTDFFQEEHAVEKLSLTLDTLVTINQFPLPDLIKMDVQGAEMDILKGAQKCLAAAKDVILELQHVEYNTGAPNRETVIEYMNQLGFDLVKNFTMTHVDGDYHFKKR